MQVITDPFWFPWKQLCIKSHRDFRIKLGCSLQIDALTKSSSRINRRIDYYGSCVGFYGIGTSSKPSLCKRAQQHLQWFLSSDAYYFCEIREIYRTEHFRKSLFFIAFLKGDIFLACGFALLVYCRLFNVYFLGVWRSCLSSFHLVSL